MADAASYRPLGCTFSVGFYFHQTISRPSGRVGVPVLYPWNSVGETHGIFMPRGQKHMKTPWGLDGSSCEILQNIFNPRRQKPYEKIRGVSVEFPYVICLCDLLQFQHAQLHGAPRQNRRCNIGLSTVEQLDRV